MTGPRTSASKTVVRCAVYCRKSTEEGLQQEFDSLDAQREAGEAFVKSQAGEGWLLQPDRYDDGGYTGGNTDRPALQRLLADVEAGRVDVVVVYKVDRLSRSLLDFGRLMEQFEKHDVDFVSVTQQLNTASSMGRLILNVLLSFAQFERELIAERTRDKIGATRRKGKWTGGHPILGYDLSSQGVRLVVNEVEAEKVREVFRLYLEHQGLLPVVRELARRGWTTKRWTTGAGQVRGGRPFTKNAIHKLLSNCLYHGLVRHRDETFPGEHSAIVDADLWRRVQTALQRNGRSGGQATRGRSGALLQGLIRCTNCDCSMAPSSTRRGSKQYRYYTCTNAQKRGWDACPSKSISAGEVDRFVVDRLRAIGRDPALLQETLKAVGERIETERATLDAERRALVAERRRDEEEVRALVAAATTEPLDEIRLGRLAESQERILRGERRVAEIDARLEELERGRIDEADVETALAEFDPLWDALTPAERVDVVRLLVARVDFDGAQVTVTLHFAAAGLRALADGRILPALEKRA